MSDRKAQIAKLQAQLAQLQALDQQHDLPMPAEVVAPPVVPSPIVNPPQEHVPPSNQDKPRVSTNPIDNQNLPQDTSPSDTVSDPSSNRKDDGTDVSKSSDQSSPLFIRTPKKADPTDQTTSDEENEFQDTDVPTEIPKRKDVIAEDAKVNDKGTSSENSNAADGDGDDSDDSVELIEDNQVENPDTARKSMGNRSEGVHDPYNILDTNFRKIENDRVRDQVMEIHRKLQELIETQAQDTFEDRMDWRFDQQKCPRKEINGSHFSGLVQNYQKDMTSCLQQAEIYRIMSLWVFALHNVAAPWWLRYPVYVLIQDDRHSNDNTKDKRRSTAIPIPAKQSYWSFESAMAIRNRFTDAHVPHLPTLLKLQKALKDPDLKFHYPEILNPAPRIAQKLKMYQQDPVLLAERKTGSTSFQKAVLNSLKESTYLHHATLYNSFCQELNQLSNQEDTPTDPPQPPPSSDSQDEQSPLMTRKGKRKKRSGKALTLAKRKRSVTERPSSSRVQTPSSSNVQKPSSSKVQMEDDSSPRRSPRSKTPQASDPPQGDTAFDDNYRAYRHQRNMVSDIALIQWTMTQVRQGVFTLDQAIMFKDMYEFEKSGKK